MKIHFHIFTYVVCLILLMSLVSAVNTISINRVWVEEDATKANTFNIYFDIIDQYGNPVQSKEDLDYTIQMESGGMKAPVLNNNNFNAFSGNQFVISASGGRLYSYNVILEKDGLKIDDWYNVDLTNSENPTATKFTPKQDEQCTCQDTDGGLNYYEKGTLTYTTQSAQKLTLTDECYDNSVREYACWDKFSGEAIDCSKVQSNQYRECFRGCSGGACNPINKQEVTITKGEFIKETEYKKTGDCQINEDNWLKEGARFDIDNKKYYCLYGSIKEQKQNDENCSGFIECKSMKCENGKCSGIADPETNQKQIIDKESQEDSKPGFFTRIINWFKSLFG